MTGLAIDPCSSHVVRYSRSIIRVPLFDRSVRHSPLHSMPIVCASPFTTRFLVSGPLPPSETATCASEARYVFHGASGSPVFCTLLLGHCWGHDMHTIQPISRSPAGTAPPCRYPEQLTAGTAERMIADIPVRWSEGAFDMPVNVVGWIRSLTGWTYYGVKIG